MLHSEFLFRVANEIEMPNEDKDFIKTGPPIKGGLGGGHGPPPFMTSYFAEDVFLEIRFGVVLQGIQKLIIPSTPRIFMRALKKYTKSFSIYFIPVV